jgi:hypothetical protein
MTPHDVVLGVLCFSRIDGLTGKQNYIRMQVFIDITQIPLLSLPWVVKILSLVILHCPFAHPPFALLPQLLRKKLQNLSKPLSREQFPSFHALSKRLAHTPQHCPVMLRMQVSCPTSLYLRYSHSSVIEKNDASGRQPSVTDVDESEEEGSAELEETDEQELSVLHVSCKQV